MFILKNPLITKAYFIKRIIHPDGCGFIFLWLGRQLVLLRKSIHRVWKDIKTTAEIPLSGPSEIISISFVWEWAQINTHTYTLGSSCINLYCYKNEFIYFSQHNKTSRISFHVNPCKSTSPFKWLHIFSEWMHYNWLDQSPTDQNLGFLFYH